MSISRLEDRRSYRGAKMPSDALVVGSGTAVASVVPENGIVTRDKWFQSRSSFRWGTARGISHPQL